MKNLSRSIYSPFQGSRSVISSPKMGLPATTFSCYPSHLPTFLVSPFPLHIKLSDIGHMKGSLDHLGKLAANGLMHRRPRGGPTHGYMKCFACEKNCVNSQWGLGAGCRHMQRLSICDHEKTKITNP